MKTGNKRIEWIDMCRGLIMILVVIGHSIPVSAPLRFLIFTFHMPALFVISGMVYKPCGIGTSIVKYAKRLLIPLYGGCILLLCYRMYDISTWGGKKADYIYWIKRTIKSSLFASGVAEPKGWPEIYALGMLWFLAAMFWAMIFFNLAITLTKKYEMKISMFVCIFIAYGGYKISLEQSWLPMNIDISMMAVLYLFMGYAIKQHDILSKKKEAFSLFIVSIILWVINYNLEGKIEMSQRIYGLYILSFLASMAGSYILICLCSVLYQNNVVSRFLSYIGNHSLAFLVFHFIDSNMIKWDTIIQGSTEDPTYCCIWIQYRIVFILMGVVLWNGFLTLLSKGKTSLWRKKEIDTSENRAKN